jgi:LysM repeat protein
MAKKVLFVLGVLLLVLSVVGLVITPAVPPKSYLHVTETVGADQFAPPTMTATLTQSATPSPTSTQTPTLSPTASLTPSRIPRTSTALPHGVPTRTPKLPTSTPTLRPTRTPTVAGTSATGCTPPQGWSPYTVKIGDTLFALAKQVNLTPEELMRSNCLASSLISVGDTLYLPVEPCTPSPPPGWSTYVVRSGDTLFALATSRDTTVDEVKQVNCLMADSLEVGGQLYLPPLAAVSSSPTPPPPGYTIIAYWSVQPGQTLDCIGRYYQVSPGAIASVNHIPWPYYIYPGQVLAIPNVPWYNIPPGAVCYPGVPNITPTPPPAMSPTPPPAVSDTSTAAAPGISPTPLPTLIIEAEWPNELQTGVSDFVRISLIGNAPVGFEVTIEGLGHEGVVSSPIPIGTKEQPLAKAYGPTYRACAAPSLNSTTISLQPDTVDCRSLDEGPWRWEWSISSDKIGTQLLIMNMTVNWTPQNGGESVGREIWHQRVSINVKEPLIVMGQLNVLSIVAGLIGAALALPFASEWLKARKSRPRGWAEE